MLITRGLATALLVTVGYGLDNSNTGNATPITLGFLGDTIITKGYTGSFQPPLPPVIPPVQNIHYGGGGGVWGNGNYKRVKSNDFTPVTKLKPIVLEMAGIDINEHEEEMVVVFVLTELVSRGII